MAEPTTTVAATVASTVVVPTLVAFGVSLGLRVDLLVAGFAGGIVGIILLSTVPSSGDTWRALLRDTARRMGVTIASSLVAGYITPLAMLINNIPEALLVGSAFVVGGGAQHVLAGMVRKFSTPTPATPPVTGPRPGDTQ